MRREDLIGRHFVEYSVPDEVERYKEHFARLQSGDPVRLRTRVLTDAGRERILDVNATPL